MKIIQSFAKYKEGSWYNNPTKNSQLNFYSFLLSYLTLNKYYGHVTMVCNKEAYDDFIKYIPYDEIIFHENKNEFPYWSVYKLDALRLIDDDVIHVDTDVFIFDDLFRPFIDGNYDVIAQDFSMNNGTGIQYVRNNGEFLNENDIIKANIYDGGFTSCGVVGLKKRAKNRYYDAVDKTYSAMKTDLIKGLERNLYAMVIEELTLYLVILNNGYSAYNILSSEIIDGSAKNIGDVCKFTHMWFSSKFDAHNVDLMRRKIRNEFPFYRKLIDKFEMELIKK